MSKAQYVLDIQACFAAQKVLKGLEAPKWNVASHGPGLVAKFPVEIGGVVSEHTVTVTSRSRHPPDFHISLHFNGGAVISRVDHEDLRHGNPTPWFDWPAIVSGPHFHPWPLNTIFADPTKHWQLQVAIPLAPNIQRFDSTFRWFCGQNNIQQPEDLFDLPEKTGLL